MTLEIGSRLGPYEIVSAIGAGGMGEVYRARDTHLNRDVAIKVLPTAFTLDADRLVAVAYTASGSTFTAGKPRLISSVEIKGSLADIAPDGKNFAVITTGASSTAPEVPFVVNFFDEIRRRLAAGK
jgi:serine/threonine protein kinase